MLRLCGEPFESAFDLVIVDRDAAAQLDPAGRGVAEQHRIAQSSGGIGERQQLGDAVVSQRGVFDIDR